MEVRKIISLCLIALTDVIMIAFNIGSLSGQSVSFDISQCSALTMT